MKKLLTLLMTLTIGLSLSACASQSESTVSSSSDSSEKIYKIAVAQYAQHPSLDQANQGFLAALQENGYIDGENVEISQSNASGDSANIETVANTIVNGGYDLAYAIATPMAQALATKSKELPIVISAVTDPVNSGLVESNEKPNTNVTGASDLTSATSSVETMLTLDPSVKTVGIMYCNSEDNSRVQAQDLLDAAKQAGLETKEYTVADSSQIQSVVDLACSQVDGILIGTDNLLAENMALVSQIANNNGVITVVGAPSMSEDGGTASMGVDYYTLGYQAGLMAIEILQGKDPADMAIYVTPTADLSLYINQASIDALGLQLSDDILNKATIY